MRAECRERPASAADVGENARARDARLGGRADFPARVGIDRTIEVDLELGELRHIRVGNVRDEAAA